MNMQEGFGGGFRVDGFGGGSPADGYGSGISVEDGVGKGRPIDIF